MGMIVFALYLAYVVNHDGSAAGAVNHTAFYLYQWVYIAACVLLSAQFVFIIVLALQDKKETANKVFNNAINSTIANVLYISAVTILYNITRASPNSFSDYPADAAVVMFLCYILGLLVRAYHHVTK